MRVRADVSAVAVADIRNGGAMGGNAGRFIKVPKYGSFFAIKSDIMVSWEHDDFSCSPIFFNAAWGSLRAERQKTRHYHFYTQNFDRRY